MNELQKRLISSIFLIPLSFFFIIKGSNYFLFFLIICFLLSCYEWNKMIKNKIFLLLGYTFLFISFLSAFYIRENLNDFGLFIFLFLIIISISTDIGGYTFGKFFKGPKLTKISPNKTYAGVIGGFLLSILIGALFKNYFINNYIDNNLFNINFLFLIIFLSFISQVGDLIISYFKRASKLDNTGKLIPGHGGILDRIDGMIFVIPTFYFLNNIYKII